MHLNSNRHTETDYEFWLYNQPPASAGQQPVVAGNDELPAIGAFAP